MAKKKTVREANEELLEGVLDDVLIPPEDPTPNDVEPTEVVPPINSADWTDFFLSKLTPDELWDGCPTIEGLRRFTADYVGVVTESFSDVKQAPTVQNGNHSCVTHHLTIECLSPFEAPWLGNMAERTIRYSGVADVFAGNGSRDSFSWQYSSSTCETRAESRAYRKLLRLRKVVTKEELSELSAEESGLNGLANESQMRGLNVITKRLDINTAEFLRKCWEKTVNGADTKDLSKLPYETARKAAITLNPWQQDMSKIPPELKGYNPNWLSAKDDDY